MVDWFLFPLFRLKLTRGRDFWSLEEAEEGRDFVDRGGGGISKGGGEAERGSCLVRSGTLSQSSSARRKEGVRLASSQASRQQWA